MALVILSIIAPIGPGVRHSGDSTPLKMALFLKIVQNDTFEIPSTAFYERSPIPLIDAKRRREWVKHTFLLNVKCTILGVLAGEWYNLTQRNPVKRVRSQRRRIGVINRTHTEEVGGERL